MPIESAHPDLASPHEASQHEDTPLLEVHRSLGARFTDFAGWRMPLRYTSELAEHRAVRQQAGLFDLSHMGEIEVRGPGAAAALDYALVSELSAVREGRAKYTMICADDGGVLDDLVVYRLGEQRFLVVANAGNAGLVLALLTERASGFAAEVADRGARTALLAVQGPRAAAIVAAVCDVSPAGLRYYGCAPARAAGQEVLLARTGYTGEDGFELYCQASGASALWSALRVAGLPHGLRPAGLACRDTLRLEAGMPLYGNELTPARTPFEAGLGHVVNLGRQADFVGRAALERRREPGQVLAGLRGAGRRSPRHGNPLVHDGQLVGEVTSGAPSPTLEYPIALGYLPRHLSRPGTELAADIRGRAEPVTVVPLPFYKRARR